ncbi:MAG: aminotransferase class V-fold PLP-dependent enzyme, partial [Rhodothermales bacterium]
LTGGGTIANLEATWVARESHPDRGVAVSDQAHYTHFRLGNVLKMETRTVPSDEHGRMQLEALEPAVRRGEIGTIVVTAGTTGLGAVDPIADVVEWRDRYGVRVHVDAAYGGFFALSAADPSSPLDAETRRHLEAIGACDSIVVDPHKHGLQPYGCGCVLFRNPEAGRVYRHESPYTYFTSEELHLGEISFECSRPGAAAGALWLTLQVLPLEASAGLGTVVTAGLRAARQWHRRLEKSDALRSYMPPELDIVTYFPEPESSSKNEQPPRTTRTVSARSQQIFERGMDRAEDPVFVSILREDAGRFIERHGDISADTTEVRLLRSVMMKPEHEHYVDELYRLVMDAVRI